MFVETINPSVYPELTSVLEFLKPHKDWCIAGGAGRNYLERLVQIGQDTPVQTTVSDFDVFTFSSKSFLKIQESLVDLGFSIKYTQNAWLIKAKKDEIKVDLIFNSEFTNPEEVVDSFDFRCCQVFITPENVVTAKEHVLEDITNRELSLVSMHRPYGILNRLQSYALKGYKLTESFAESFVDAIRILDDEDLDLSFSYSDPASFSWAVYDEETNNERNEPAITGGSYFNTVPITDLIRSLQEERRTNNLVREVVSSITAHNWSNATATTSSSWVVNSPTDPIF